MILPADVQRLFYRYHPGNLDPDRHQDVIIPTVLSDGTLADWDWLFGLYGWEALRNWLRDPQYAQLLPPPMEHFWSTVLLGEPKESPHWSGGNALREVPPDALPAWFPPDLR